jgi:hypothetical protein
MRTWIVVAALAALLLGTAGCVQMPTEKQGVSDMRPQISFVAAESLSDAVVYVDNVAVGLVGDFRDGTAALRILPGTHVVRVVAGDRVLLDERYYIGDGVSRSFVVQ